MLEVRHAIPADCAALGVSLARAFADDPVWRWLVPDDDRWQRRAARFMAIDAANRVRLGHVYTVAGLYGTAEWCPPGAYKPRVADMAREGPASLLLFGRSVVRALRFLTMVERAHPPEPDHWYLAMLGTEPDHQGKGIGSALLQPILDVCDREERPAYLESSKESNIAFYARHGFELRDPLTAKDGPTIYPMWRDPRT